MKKILLLLFSVALFCGCGSKSTATAGCDSIIYKPRYATRFEIAQRGDSVIIRTQNPWQGANEIHKEFSFVPPLSRLVCMSSSHTAFVEALNSAYRIVAVSGREFIFSDSMRVKEDIGYERSLAFEKIVSLRPDAMTVYEVAGENSSNLQKLSQLGVPIVYIADYLENDPLGRAEWIVAIGALIGKQKEAQQLFDSIVIRYETLRSQISTTDTTRPKVMLNSPYRDVWYMPGDSNYMIRLITDAGADYLGAGVKDDKSRPISLETAYKMLSQADLWLNPSMGINTREDLDRQNANFAKIKIPVFSSIERTTPGGGSDFWESGVTKPDVILKDLVKIFHPTTLPDHKLYYFKELQ